MGQVEVSHAALSEYRKIYNRNVIKRKGVGIIILFLLVVALVAAPKAASLTLITAAVVVFLFFVGGVDMPKDSACETFYNMMAAPIVSSVFDGQAEYVYNRPLGGVNPGRLPIYRHTPEKLQQTDYISGAYGGVQFECVNLDATYKDRDGEGNISTVSEFCGILISLPFRKNSETVLTVMSYTPDEKSHLHGYDIMKCPLENERFKQTFKIISHDDHNMFYVLSPDVMEKLLYMSDNNTFGRWGGDVRFCFEADRMYVGISAPKYMSCRLRLPGERVLEGVQSKFYGDINLLKSVLDMAVRI